MRRPSIPLVALTASLLACAAPPRAPRSADTAVLVFDASSSGVALFADERASVRDAVASFLAAQPRRGWRPVRRADLDAALARAVTTHRLSADGPACERVPDETTLARRMHPGALLAFTHLSCETRCSMSVEVIRVGDRDRFERVAFWAADVPSAEPARWTAAVASLAEPPPDGQGGGGLGLLAGSADDAPVPRVEVLSVDRVGPWRTAPDVASFAPAQPLLERCHERVGSGANDNVYLAVDATGAVSRCEARVENSDADRGRAACLCDAVRGVTFGAGDGDRRLHVRVMITPASGVQAGALCVRARVDGIEGDPVARAAGVGSVNDAVARCAVESGMFGPTRFTVTLDVSATGRATGASVEGAGLSDALRACVAGVFQRDARTMCASAPSGARLVVSMAVSAQREACEHFR